MKLTQTQLKRIIVEELQKVMQEGGSFPQLRTESEKKFVSQYIDVEYDDYETTPGWVADMIVNSHILAPDAFIASAPEEDIDPDDDEAMYRRGEMGTEELWVGKVGDVEIRSQNPKVADRYRAMLETTRGFHVVTATGMGWYYEAGPFQSFDEAKQAGFQIAKEKGYQTAEEIDPDSVYRGERDI
jgi:hypothetical protein